MSSLCFSISFISFIPQISWHLRKTFWKNACISKLIKSTDLTFPIPEQKHGAFFCLHDIFLHETFYKIAILFSLFVLLAWKLFISCPWDSFLGRVKLRQNLVDPSFCFFSAANIVATIYTFQNWNLKFRDFVGKFWSFWAFFRLICSDAPFNLSIVVFAPASGRWEVIKRIISA